MEILNDTNNEILNITYNLQYILMNCDNRSCNCILQTKVQASDIHGLFHGVNTFMQLMVLCQEGGIPHLQVNDNNTDTLANITYFV